MRKAGRGMSSADRSEHTDLAARIQAVTSTLSRAERKIVRVLHATNFRIGAVSVASLAEQAGVSGPSVIRFMGRLGYPSYRSLQEAAEAQSGERVESPATLYQRGRVRRHVTDLDAVSDSICGCVRKTLAMADEGELGKIIKILANERRHICTLGGRGSDVFAQMLAARLYQIRPNVRAVGGQPLGFSREDQLSFMGARDVVFAFDFRRYEESTIFFARTAAQRGATVILVTDAWLSPIADFASHVMTIYSDSGGPYDYWTPCLAMVETVLELMLSEMDADAVGERIRLTEQYARGLLGDYDAPPAGKTNPEEDQAE